MNSLPPEAYKRKISISIIGLIIGIHPFFNIVVSLMLGKLMVLKLIIKKGIKRKKKFIYNWLFIINFWSNTLSLNLLFTCIR